jgi:hypothetical protein
MSSLEPESDLTPTERVSTGRLPEESPLGCSSASRGKLDAEGRVILSDGLFAAQRYEPDAIIEFSTLTGAIIVALGNIVPGCGSSPSSRTQ